MKKSVDRKLAARALRTKGYSVKQIALEVGAAQSSISIWVRDIELTKDQQEKLMANMHSTSTIAKRRLVRMLGEKVKRDVIFRQAKEQIDSISDRELWLIGVALYWAEGGKGHSAVKFSNGDPRMIKLFLMFLVKVFAVDLADVRVHIHIHENLDSLAAEKYWQEITKLPPQQFYKTYNKPNKSSKATRNSLPYGVCDIYLCKSSKELLKIAGWTEGIYQSITA